jgi:hypothetical protein
MQHDAKPTAIQLQDARGGVCLSARHDGYQRLGVIHARSVELETQSRLTIIDELTGDGLHDVEVVWHLSPAWQVSIVRESGSQVACSVRGPSSVEMTFCSGADLVLRRGTSLISRAYGLTCEGASVTVCARAALPFQLRAAISWKNN